MDNNGFNPAEKKVSAEVLLPSGALRHYIHHYWVLKAHDTYMSQTIMPIGCLKWIFHRKRPFKILEDRDDNKVATVVGLYDKAINIRSDKDLEMITVFFQPYTAKAIMGISCKDFSNINCDLDDLGSMEFRDLKKRVLDAYTSDHAIEMIETFIIRLLATKRESPYLKPLACVFEQMKSHPEVRIDELASTACLSERQFRRVFLDNVGMNPKQLQRIQRFKQAISTIITTPRKNLDDLLYRYGYTDHSHFNHEFHNIAGLSPSDYLNYLEEVKRQGIMPIYRSYHSPKR